MAQLFPDSVKAQMPNLSADQKLRFLASLSMQITVATRVAYPQLTPREEAIKRFITFNEIQHQISNKLLGIVNPKPDTYPDEAFIDALVEIARPLYEGDLQWAIEFALQLVLRQQ